MMSRANKPGTSKREAEAARYDAAYLRKLNAGNAPDSGVFRLPKWHRPHELWLLTRLTRAYDDGHVQKKTASAIEEKTTHAISGHDRAGQHVGLGLIDQVDGQEPVGQQQLGVSEQAASGLRRLVAAGAALEQPAHTMSHHVLGRPTAAQADEPVRQTRQLDRCFTLRFSTEAAHELRQRQAGLKLQSGHRQGCSSAICSRQITALLANHVTWVEPGCKNYSVHL